MKKGARPKVTGKKPAQGADKKAAQGADGGAGGEVGTSIVVRLLASHNLLLGALRRGLGLPLGQFDLLMQLLREDGQTPASLSRRMLVTAGNLTGLVDRAERDGLVERRADPRDRRRTRVFLTAVGGRQARRAQRRHHELADELVGPLSATDQQALRRLLGQLRSALEQHGKGNA